MFCEQCGAPIPEGAKFCENCGAPVPQETAPVAPPEPKPEPKPEPAPIPRSGERTPRRFSPLRLVIGTIFLGLIAYAAYWVLYVL